MKEKSLLILTSVDEMSQVIQEIAVKRSYLPTILNSGLSLLGSLESLKPDLMLLDLDLTDMDGVELLTHLGKIQCRIPIILISSGDEKLLFSLTHIAHEKKLNIISMLRYPFSAGTLESKLDLSKQSLSFVEAADIALAIEKEHFVLHYQPKIDIRTRKWVGMEALIRWTPPSQPMIMPEVFIPLAEESGLIVPMTAWAIKQSFEDLVQFRQEHPNIKIAVNLSSKLLSDLSFPDEIIRMTKEMRLLPTLICFEVTESATSNQPQTVLEVLLRLRLKGFSLSIDDFGTGYSSLVELQRLPFTELKIDKSFVIGIEDSPMNQSIVKAIIYLGHTLGLTLVAEGVETPEALALLTEFGCDIAQGYLISRPLPFEALKAWRATCVTDDLVWQPLRIVPPELKSSA